MEASKGGFLSNLIKKILGNKFYLSSSFMVIVTVFAGGINFLFNILVSRHLGPEKYGIVYPLTSLLMIIGLPSITLQYVITKDLSKLIKENDYGTLKKYFARVALIILGFAIALAAVLFFLVPVLKDYLRVEDANAFYIIIASMFITTAGISFQSLIQSRERFFPAGTSQFLSVLIKFGIGVGIVYAMTTYFGILWGILSGTLVLFIIILIDGLRFKEMWSADTSTTNPEYFNVKRLSRSLILTLMSVGVFQLMTYIDSVMVRHYLESLSGTYSTVNVLGKASFFIATGISYVILPHMSKDKENVHRSNKKGLLFLFIFLIAYAVFLAVFSGFISKFLFGEKFVGMEKILPLYGFMFIPYAAISFMVNYYIVSENIIYSLTLVGGVILQYIGITLFHKDLTQVSLVFGAVGYLLFFILFLDSVILQNIREKKKLDSNSENSE